MEVFTLNHDQEARLDIKASVFGEWDKRHFDMSVLHSNTPPYMSKSLRRTSQKHEQEKKSAMYIQRVCDVKRAAFALLVSPLMGEWQQNVQLSTSTKLHDC